MMLAATEGIQVAWSSLGLAVVQQIVTAHGWSVECLANESKGATFRIGRIKRATTN